MPHIQVVQAYISWTDIAIAPIRQLVGAKRISLLSPSKSADVSYHEKQLVNTLLALIPLTESTISAATYSMFSCASVLTIMGWMYMYLN